jgi:signal transduction histidine kinase
MHTGVTGQIRKAAVGRWLLFHINTGLFWIYGILTLWLAFSVSSFWFQNVATRILFSVPPALLAAFMLARLVHALFWHRFRNVWMDNYVIGVFLLAILLVGYAHDVHDGRDDARFRLAMRTTLAVIAGLASYVSNRKRAA